MTAVTCGAAPAGYLVDVANRFHPTVPPQLLAEAFNFTEPLTLQRAADGRWRLGEWGGPAADNLFLEARLHVVGDIGEMRCLPPVLRAEAPPDEAGGPARPEWLCPAPESILPQVRPAAALCTCAVWYLVYVWLVLPGSCLCCTMSLCHFFYAGCTRQGMETVQ